MLTVNTPADLAKYRGQSLGSSDWLDISQEQISQFAQLTGDDHWIHVNIERARNEMPDGKTIAHGFFMLSLIPLLARGIFRIETRGKGLNYGLDRLRFINPVQVGTRIRLHQRLLEAEPRDGATLFTIENTFEIEGQARPALVATMLLLIYHA